MGIKTKLFIILLGVLILALLPGALHPDEVASSFEVKPVKTSKISGIEIRYVVYRGVRIPLVKDAETIGKIEKKLNGTKIDFFEKDLGRTDTCYIYVYDLEYLGGIIAKKKGGKIIISSYPLQRDVIEIFINQEEKETTK